MNAEASSKRPSSGSILLVAATAIAGAAITFLAHEWVDGAVNRAAAARFQFKRSETVSAIEARMAAYESVLRGTEAVFEVKPRLSREEWRDYTAGLAMDIHFPGIQALGFSEWIAAADLPAYEARIRAEGYPEFSVKPARPRDVYTSITYIEPMDARNRAAFGYDMWSQETRRDAMRRARDTGKASISGPVKLVQEIDSDVQAGILMYLPHYAGRIEPTTIFERRTANTSFVYGAFRMRDLMHGILETSIPDIGIAIYDGVETSADTLLYESEAVPQDRPPRFMAEDQVEVYGRTWRIVSHSKPTLFAHDGGISIQHIVLAGGACVTLLVMLLMVSFLTTRRRARALAMRMTAQLSEAIRKQELVEEELRHRATTDALTGLSNRAAFNERLTEIADGRAAWPGTHGLILLDLDRFKVVNDTLGHTAGDRLLMAIGARLTGRMGNDVLIARLGGDEFALVVPDEPDLARSHAVAAEIAEMLEAPVMCDGRPIRTSACAGIASVEPGPGHAHLALSRADIALYRAKAAGRNTIRVFDAALEADVISRSAIEAALDGATARGEMHLEYQPKMDSHTGSVVGVEALLRWHSPELGFVPPDVFIGIAEETDHIGEIAAWVFDTACAQAREWIDTGVGTIPIAINVSPQQLQVSNLTQTITTVLKRYDLPADLLELEITETMLIQDYERAREQLTRLRALGIRISIDDFGTGYSSLAYLHKLNVDVLKIDRSFVSSLDNEHSQSIVESILALARSLRLRTVAEGVETVEQAQFLRAHGCQELQGWLFSKSLRPDALAAWMSTLEAEARPLEVQLSTA